MQHRQGAIRLRNGAVARIKTTPPTGLRQTRTIELVPARLQDNRVVTAEAYHPVTDVYRSLRARVLQALSSRRKRTVGITSPNHGEGKTLTAVNLAIALAMDVRHTALLVDANLRSPGVARCLGIEPTLGLADYLTGKAELGDCLLRSKIDGLTILPALAPANNAAELLSSPQMLYLAGELRDRYADRLIIYDLPPILAVGDAIGFLPAVDTTLLVVREGATRVADLTQSLERLSGCNLIGTVLNGSS